MAILCYHGVEPDWHSRLTVPPQDFARHCGWLAHKRTVLQLRQAVQLLGRSGGLPRGTTALTFDDGFASLYEHAFPVLVRYRLPATIFLVVGTLMARGQAVDWLDAPDVLPPGAVTLSLEQIQEMQSAGIQFGSHSFSHRDLTELSDAECEHDLRHSRESLEDLLRCPVRFLAYPRGRHNVRVRRAAAQAGYSHAFSLPEGPEPVGPLAVPRVGIWAGNTVPMLRLKASTTYLRLRMSPLSPMQLRLRGKADGERVRV